MTPLPIAKLPPALQAAADYRHGGGQDENPFDKTLHPDEHHDYAYAMHALWSRDFKRELQDNGTLGRAIQREIDHDDTTASEAHHHAGDRPPPF